MHACTVIVLRVGCTYVYKVGSSILKRRYLLGERPNPRILEDFIPNAVSEEAPRVVFPQAPDLDDVVRGAPHEGAHVRGLRGHDHLLPPAALPERHRNAGRRQVKGRPQPVQQQQEASA